MKGNQLGGSINIDLEKLAHKVNISLPLLLILFLILSFSLSLYYLIPAGIFLALCLANVYYLYIQKHHSLLMNFGLVAQVRYILESIGPEFRQYLFLNDQEERPFNRVERSEIYRKAKGVTSTYSFGSQQNFKGDHLLLRHSLYPSDKKKLEKFDLVVGEERGIKKAYHLKNPFMISAMSYGALGEKAVRALARGAKYSNIIMNTGEGGYPKYHLMEGCDLIFQMGTAKFGVRNEDGSLSEEKLKEVSSLEQVKMIEIKFSQGAKPGKGGILPKEKITKEISELRGIPENQDAISPPYHSECKDAESTVAFIKKIQDLSELPTGIKLCLGKVNEFEELVVEMKKQNIFPDYISIDGSEGGTGAAPLTFMDDVGIPIFKALPQVQEILKKHQVRDRLKLFAAGKLISPGKHFKALAMGADAVYSARAFMMAIGCIQALQCNKNTCPVGITTHKDSLQRGLDVELKAQRVQQFVESISKEYKELLVATGRKSLHDLGDEELYRPEHQSFARG